MRLEGWPRKEKGAAMHSRGLIRPGFTKALALKKLRAQGMPDALAHPQPCVQK